MVYKHLLFFSPRNYGFFNARHIDKYPSTVTFKSLRRFFWFQRRHNAYEKDYLKAILKYQALFIFCLYHAISMALEKIIAKIFRGLKGYLRSLRGKKNFSPDSVREIKMNISSLYFNYLMLKFLFLKGAIFNIKIFKESNFANKLKSLIFAVFILSIAIFVLFAFYNFFYNLILIILLKLYKFISMITFINKILWEQTTLFGFYVIHYDLAYSSIISRATKTFNHIRIFFIHHKVMFFVKAYAFSFS